MEPSKEEQPPNWSYMSVEKLDDNENLRYPFYLDHTLLRKKSRRDLK